MRRQIPSGGKGRCLGYSTVPHSKAVVEHMSQCLQYLTQGSEQVVRVPCRTGGFSLSCIAHTYVIHQTTTWYSFYRTKPLPPLQGLELQPFQQCRSKKCTFSSMLAFAVKGFPAVIPRLAAVRFRTASKVAIQGKSRSPARTPSRQTRCSRRSMHVFVRRNACILTWSCLGRPHKSSGPWTVSQQRKPFIVPSVIFSRCGSTKSLAQAWCCISSRYTTNMKVGYL